MKKQESLCNNCRLEGRYPDCGATVKDYEAKKGIGVTECKKHIPLMGYMSNLKRSNI